MDGATNASGNIRASMAPGPVAIQCTAVLVGWRARTTQHIEDKFGSHKLTAFAEIRAGTHVILWEAWFRGTSDLRFQQGLEQSWLGIFWILVSSRGLACTC